MLCALTLIECIYEKDVADSECVFDVNERRNQQKGRIVFDTQSGVATGLSSISLFHRSPPGRSVNFVSPNLSDLDVIISYINILVLNKIGQQFSMLKT